MTTLLQFSLAAHVILGVVGVAALYLVLLHALKKDPSLPMLKWASLMSFLAIVASWVSGGYYYVVYYGEKVKPIIVGGAYPWAHKVMTETKEHIFLFLPFAALALAVLFWFSGELVKSDEKVRRGAVFLASAATTIGIIITLAGIIISGAVR